MTRTFCPQSSRVAGTRSIGLALLLALLCLLSLQSPLSLCHAAKSAGSGKKSSSSSGGVGMGRLSDGGDDRGDRKGRGDSSAALPRAKGSKVAKNKGGATSLQSLTSRLGGGLVYRVFREMKTAFGSELEALTLTLTRPVEAGVPEASLEELAQVRAGVWVWGSGWGEI